MAGQLRTVIRGLLHQLYTDGHFASLLCRGFVGTQSSCRRYHIGLVQWHLGMAYLGVAMTHMRNIVAAVQVLVALSII